MDIDAALKQGDFAAQNGFNQVVARDDVTGSLQKIGQKIKLNGRQFDFLIPATNRTRTVVEFDVTENNRFGVDRSQVREGSGAAPQESLNPCGKLARIERLHQVVVGADFETVNAIDVIAAGRE